MDSKGDNTPIGHNGPCSELIYYNGIVYEGWVDFLFTFMYKGVLIITQGCIGASEIKLFHNVTSSYYLLYIINIKSKLFDFRNYPKYFFS